MVEPSSQTLPQDPFHVQEPPRVDTYHRSDEPSNNCEEESPGLLTCLEASPEAFMTDFISSWRPFIQRADGKIRKRML